MGAVIGLSVLGLLIWGVLAYQKWRARLQAEEEARVDAHNKRLVLEHCQRLLRKYNGDEALVTRLMRREVWIGQTEEMLRDSMGDPGDIDEKVMKTKTTRTWKYHRTGSNRYALRIVTENGTVTGWDDKR